jgi:hypothetical protein
MSVVEQDKLVIPAVNAATDTVTNPAVDGQTGEAGEQAAAHTAEGTGQGQDPSQSSAPQLSARTKRYVDEQVRRRHDAERAAAVSNAEATALRTKLANLDKQPIDANNPNAIIERVAQRAIAAAHLQVVEGNAQTHTETARLALEADWQKQTEIAEKKFPDFRQVVEREPSQGGPTITETMAGVIKEMDRGAELAYYLGKNPGEAHEIARLPASSQALALADLRETLPKIEARVSQAPTPITALSGKQASATVKYSDDMSMEEYNNWRNAQKKS